MGYVDGFVIPILKRHLPTYRRIAAKACKIWMEHGALEYRESFGDDLKPAMGGSFPKLARAKKGETVVFAWIVYKSRAHRDRVNKKVMKDPRLAAMMKNAKMPFEMKRMAYGGFKIVVEG